MLSQTNEELETDSLNYVHQPPFIQSKLASIVRGEELDET